MLFLHILQKITLTKVTYFSKICNRTEFQDPVLSDASALPTHQSLASAILLLLIAGNWNVRGRGGLQRHNVFKLWNFMKID